VAAGTDCRAQDTAAVAADTDSPVAEDTGCQIAVQDTAAVAADSKLAAALHNLASRKD
jgi:hypothetical protein